MIDLRLLSERRADDRTFMAAHLAGALTALGATVTVTDVTDAREIVLFVEVPGGAKCYVDFDGASPQPNVYVVPWHTFGDTTFADSMGNVNQYHHAKVTKVAEGYPALVEMLSADVTRLISGDGYRTQEPHL